MKRFLHFVLLMLFIGSVQAQSYKQDLSIVITPIWADSLTNYGFLYRHDLKEKWELRAGLDLTIDAVQQIRSDTQQLARGTIAFRNSIGIQRNLENGTSLPPRLIYIGMDVYWNSLLKKEPQDLYYYYYSNFGFMPLIGLNYQIDRFRFLLECRSNLNLNFQSYAGNGANYDRVFSFRTADQVAFGVGYRF